jgi:hypothetical protein
VEYYAKVIANPHQLLDLLRSKCIVVCRSSIASKWPTVSFAGIAIHPDAVGLLSVLQREGNKSARMALNMLSKSGQSHCSSAPDDTALRTTLVQNLPAQPKDFV